MARISYDEQTAAFKAVREVPRDGVSEWREAVQLQTASARPISLAQRGCTRRNPEPTI